MSKKSAGSTQADDVNIAINYSANDDLSITITYRQPWGEETISGTAAVFVLGVIERLLRKKTFQESPKPSAPNASEPT